MQSDARHVIIADDDRQFAMKIGDFLKRRNYTFEHLAAPEATLAAAREGQASGVIMEPNQRGMPWVRFMRAVRAALPSSTITIVTSFNSAAMLTEARELGVHGFLTKPAAAPMVVESLERELETLKIGEVVTAEPTLDQHEWEYVNQILLRCDGNISEASRRLGIPRQTLYYKLRKQPRSAHASAQLCGVDHPLGRARTAHA